MVWWGLEPTRTDTCMHAQRTRGLEHVERLAARRDEGVPEDGAVHHRVAVEDLHEPVDAGQQALWGVGCRKQGSVSQWITRNMTRPGRMYVRTCTMARAALFPRRSSRSPALTISRVARSTARMSEPKQMEPREVVVARRKERRTAPWAALTPDVVGCGVVERMGSRKRVHIGRRAHIHAYRCTTSPPPRPPRCRRGRSWRRGTPRTY